MFVACRMYSNDVIVYSRNRLVYVSVVMSARSVRLFSLPILLHRFISSVSGFICHCGRATMDVKTCTHIYLSINLKLRRSMAVTWFALPTMQLMCWLNVNLLSTTTPRSFSITVSSSCTDVPSSEVIVQLCFTEKQSTTNLTALYSLMSSVNSLVQFCTELVIIYVIQN